MYKLKLNIFGLNDEIYFQNIVNVDWLKILKIE